MHRRGTIKQLMQESPPPHPHCEGHQGVFWRALLLTMSRTEAWVPAAGASRHCLMMHPAVTQHSSAAEPHERIEGGRGAHRRPRSGCCGYRKASRELLFLKGGRGGSRASLTASCQAGFQHSQQGPCPGLLDDGVDSIVELPGRRRRPAEAVAVPFDRGLPALLPGSVSKQGLRLRQQEPAGRKGAAASWWPDPFGAAATSAEEHVDLPGEVDEARPSAQATHVSGERQQQQQQHL